MRERHFPGTVLCCTAFALVACEQVPTTPAVDGPAFAAVSQGWRPDESVALRYLESLNGELAAAGATYTVHRIEWSGLPGVNLAAGNIVFANDRELRLESRWLPGDVRRLADGNNLTYAVFVPLAFAPGVPGNVEGVLDAAFDTWGSVKCSQLPVVKRTLAGNIFPSAILGIGGFIQDPFAADISVIGWMPGALFDAVLGPGASQFVLGLTFSFAFPTDLNGDGRIDTAHKEIWYNDAFTWTTSGGPTDIETVALHETGHALELGHFGKIHGTLANLKLHISPRAVMNAIVLGTLREPLGPDNAAYCGNYASWPN